VPVARIANGIKRFAANAALAKRLRLFVGSLWPSLGCACLRWLATRWHSKWHSVRTSNRDELLQLG
jgi:hypothetical protein